MSGPENLRAKILILGLPGSGKSMFARQLSKKLGIPHIEGDAYFWPKPEGFRPLIEKALSAAPAWIFEGHYGKVKDLIDPQLTQVIWLNYPYPLILSRWFKRSLRTRDFGDWRFLFLKRPALLRGYRNSLLAQSLRGAAILEFSDPIDAQRFLDHVNSG